MSRLKIITALIVFSFSTAKSNPLAPADSINSIDANGKKQGHWVVLNSPPRYEGCPSDAKVEEGNYVDDFKNGIWKQFYCDGKIKNELTFVTNKPSGYAKFYYTNGKLSEEGNWQNNVWVGGYKFYYENGNLAYDFNYNTQGKREGSQKYFHENGKVKIEGNWSNGQESGTLKEYYESGSLKSEKVFNNGRLDTNKVRNFAEKKSEIPREKTETIEEPVTEPIKSVPAETPKSIGILEDGFHKTYNSKGKIITEGEYKNGLLLNGKKYEYEGDKLIKTSTWKGGKLFSSQTEK